MTRQQENSRIQPSRRRALDAQKIEREWWDLLSSDIHLRLLLLAFLPPPLQSRGWISCYCYWVPYQSGNIFIAVRNKLRPLSGGTFRCNPSFVLSAFESSRSCNWFFMHNETEENLENSWDDDVKWDCLVPLDGTGEEGFSLARVSTPRANVLIDFSSFLSSLSLSLPRVNILHELTDFERNGIRNQRMASGTRSLY